MPAAMNPTEYIFSFSPFQQLPKVGEEFIVPLQYNGLTFICKSIETSPSGDATVVATVKE